MFERTLKDLANRHFEVIWRYGKHDKLNYGSLGKTVRSSMVQT